MMKTLFLTIGCLMTLALFYSCKEVYYPDEIHADERIPVMLGSIVEGQAPQVQLSWAFVYDKGRTTDFMHDAQVWITDDMGANENLAETYNGIYVPVNGAFEGLLGRTYTLHVETPEGDLYESTPEQILPVASLDSLYAEYVNRIKYVRTATGNLFPIPEEGLDVFVSLNRYSDSTCYFRFRTDVLEEILYDVIDPDAINPDSMIVDTSYSWKSYTTDDFYNVRFTYKDNEIQVVPEENIGYLNYILDLSQVSDTLSFPTTYAWIVSSHVYSVTENVYRYYSSVEDQLVAGDRIFAPVPSQISTNLHCVGDADKPVLGIFEASAVISFHKAFQWLEPGKFLSKYLEDFPQGLGDGYKLSEPPDFWIEF